MDRFEDALAAYEKAIEITPNDIEAWQAEATLYHIYLKDYPKAMFAYKKLIELDPDDAAAWYQLGCIYCLSGDKDKCLSSLQRSFEINNDPARKKFATTDKDLTSIRDDLRFKKMVE